MITTTIALSTAVWECILGILYHAASTEPEFLGSRSVIEHPVNIQSRANLQLKSYDSCDEL